MYKFTLTGFSDEISSDVKTQFEHLNKLGIKYFEPRGINGKNISELNDAEVEQLASDMKKYGIKVSSIGSPIGKIKITDDFEPHFEKFERTVEIAKKLECRFIRIFSFYFSDGCKKEDYRDEVISRLKAFIDYAEKNDIILLHENEKDIYGDTDDCCIDLMKELFCDNFKAVFDPANFVQCKVDTKSAWEKLKGYIVYMHIKDALFANGDVVPAGYGDGNVAYILSDLAANGYNGFLSLEPHLGSFSGLTDLEVDDKMLKLEKSDAAKFTLAYNSLNKILKEIEEDGQN